MSVEDEEGVQDAAWILDKAGWRQHAKEGVPLSIMFLSSLLLQDADNANFQVNILVQYLPSIVITLANFIAPLIFSSLIRFEDYTPAFEIKLTLLR